MSSKKKGDLLEILVHILEKSLADNPSQIKRDYKMPDEYGIERQIDVYAEVTVNNRILKYAFECKNHKHGIKMSDIDAFHAKIHNKGIKGYFVTTSQYQAGAIERAAAINIDLLKLKKREDTSRDIKGIIYFQQKFRITDIKLIGYVDQELPTLNNDFNNCPKCQNSLIQIVQDDVMPFLQQNLDKGIVDISPDFRDIRKVQYTIGKDNAKEFVVWVAFDGHPSLTHKGTKIYYDYIQLELESWNEVYEQSAKSKNTYSYLDNNGNDILESFSVSEFLIKDKNIIVGITKVKDGSIKMTIGNTLDADFDTKEVVCFGHIDELGIKKYIKKENWECNDD